jgi:hypothetical protein
MLVHNSARFKSQIYQSYDQTFLQEYSPYYQSDHKNLQFYMKRLSFFHFT